MDAYLTHNRNLLLQTPRDWNHATARASIRMNQLVSQPGYGSVEKKSGGVRGRKRKLKEGRTTPVSESKEEKGLMERQRQITLGLEDDVIMLEYLQVMHRGNIDRAQFMNLVQLCRGRGTCNCNMGKWACIRDEGLSWLVDYIHMVL